MFFNGIAVRRNKHWTFRNAQEGDVDSHGEPLPSNCIVFVKASDCKVVERHWEGGPPKLLDPSNAPQGVRLGMGGTSYGYFKQGKTTRIFVAKGGLVYTGRVA